MPGNLLSTRGPFKGGGVDCGSQERGQEGETDDGEEPAADGEEPATKAIPKREFLTNWKTYVPPVIQVPSAPVAPKQ